MTTNLEVKPEVKALTQALELIEQGWCRGSFCEASPVGLRYCLIGALRHSGDFDTQSNTRRLLAKAVFNKDMGTLNEAHLVDWNDSRDRTQTEVIAALDRAIALGLGLP